MSEGIVLKDKDEEIADFIINDGYEPYNVVPMCCVLSGSRAYGLSDSNSDRDYVAIHMMDTWDVLEHPDFRPRLQVIRNRFFENYTPVPDGEKGSDISLDSFEIWKYITLFLKGSPVAYELLYMPTIHCEENTESLLEIMRQGVTNRIGKSARGIAIHEWTRNKTNRKKAVMAYYRLMQAIFFLKENEFVWKIGDLLEYMEPTGIINVGKVVMGQYLEEEMRTVPIHNTDEVGEEIHHLIDEVDKAGVTTRLPDQTPKNVLQAILQKVKKTRSISI